jgi:hypothetical protein
MLFCPHAVWSLYLVAKVKESDELGCIRLGVWEREHYRPELQMVPVSLDLDLTHAALLLLQTNYSERIELKVSDGKKCTRMCCEIISGSYERRRDYHFVHTRYVTQLLNEFSMLLLVPQ